MTDAVWKHPEFLHSGMHQSTKQHWEGSWSSIACGDFQTPKNLRKSQLNAGKKQPLKQGSLQTEHGYGELRGGCIPVGVRRGIYPQENNLETLHIFPGRLCNAVTAKH